MRFQVPEKYQGLHAEDLRQGRGASPISARQLLLIGDTTVVNGLTGKPSVFPALFLAVGLTIPERGTS